jgi:hypothetical protein
LSGVATHRTWALRAGKLVLVREEQQRAGDILTCGSDLVHSMVDSGDGEPLVTLHLYIDPIRQMLVYDLESERTLLVDGQCGAWVPTRRPDLIRQTYDGFIRRPLAMA